MSAPPRAVFRACAIAEALFRDGRGAPAPERISWLAGELTDFLARAGLRARLLFSLCTFTISILAPFFVGRVGTLETLSGELRVDALARLEHSVLGIVVLPVKAILCFIYFEHPDAAAEIGVDTSCLLPRTP